jgi:hypothetical protein
MEEEVKPVEETPVEETPEVTASETVSEVGETTGTE